MSIYITPAGSVYSTIYCILQIHRGGELIRAYCLYSSIHTSTNVQHYSYVRTKICSHIEIVVWAFLKPSLRHPDPAGLKYVAGPGSTYTDNENHKNNKDWFYFQFGNFILAMFYCTTFCEGLLKNVSYFVKVLFISQEKIWIQVRTTFLPGQQFYNCNQDLLTNFLF